MTHARVLVDSRIREGVLTGDRIELEDGSSMEIATASFLAPVPPRLSSLPDRARHCFRPIAAVLHLQ